MMTQEEAGSVILNIFKRECDKAGDVLPNKTLHKEFFRKTESGLGFFEGVKWLVDQKWLAVNEAQENSHSITKAGMRADV
jgi:hypothetical protein